MSRLRRGCDCRQFGLRATLGLFLLLGFAVPHALAARYGDVEVTVEPQPSPEGGASEMRHGYVEHRVLVRNHSEATDYVVRLAQPFRPAPYYNEYLKENSRTVQVNRGSKLIVSLYQPALHVADDGIAVEIDGVRQKSLVDLRNPFDRSYGYAGGSPTLSVLTSRAIPQAYKDRVRSAQPNQVGFIRSEVPAGDWSPNWLGYTAYDVVLLTEAEAAALPADVLAALRRFAEVGGIVLIQGDTSDAAELIPSALRGADPQSDDAGGFRVGFGLVRPSPTSGMWPPEFWSLTSRDSTVPQDRLVQIVSSSDVPLGGMLFVVIAFAVGIGPLNVWLLTRRRKRMWLWWNVPLVSLITCLAVFAYALVSEGLSGRGRMAVITVLDENTHRATTIGYTSYYCPLTPSDGLRFSYDTEVTPLEAGEFGRSGFLAGVGKSADWTSDQHLESGWIAARVPAYFSIRKSETRRERLAVHRTGNGKLTVVNGLGVAIDDLYYVNEDGTVGVASNLPPGQETNLALSKPSSKPKGEPRPLRGLFEQRWNLSLEQLKDHPEVYVAPGCYLAVVKQSPFLEEALPAAPQQESVGVVYGIGARSANGR